MDAKRWQKIRSLFDAAQELDAGKRKKFLEKNCDGDEELRREVEKLLVSLESAGDFMEQPAAAEVASLFESKNASAARDENSDSGKFVAGTVLASRYRILGLLGKGGMGEVYKAEDIKLNQTVALKFLPDKLEKDKAALARFHAEVRTARSVAHPNVCRVFDIGEIEDRHFLSMEYLDGDDLSSLLRRIGRLPSDKAIEIARQLCFGLAAIHEAGILHRDLKPANIIIDSKGKARITDFGIAGLEVELSAGETSIGTPAYMSPEQITGKEISQKSDIYALGLVLYEIFTGKQAFHSDSLSQVVRRHQTTTAPTNPSDILREIDPIVERTILQCLEKDPKDRPVSAMDVALMLPGGNPLEAAIAAGKTPSPEMVAAAPKKGALRPAVAVACLAAVVGLLAFIVLYAGRVKHHEWIPLEKSPEVLAERADSILKKLGYRNAPVDTDYGFAENAGKYYDYARNVDKSPNRWERLRTGQPDVINFWYRTSPRYLEPQESETVFSNDPPLDIAGMTRVILDTRGRLLEFEAVPPQVKENRTPAATKAVDWTTLFTEAGLDIRNYQQTEPNWTPPVFADTGAAWEGAHVDHAEIPVRIEAAAYDGKPVYFQIVAPWEKAARQEEMISTRGVRTAGVILILVFSVVILAGVFLAYRNLRMRRADARGAFKLTIFIFLATLAASLLVADHIPDVARERLIFFKIAGSALFNAAVIGVIYLALEPYARRRWSSLVISWSRLMAGDWRDPLVGRDVLIGGILGLTHTALIYLFSLAPRWMGIDIEPNPSLEIIYLQGFRHLWAKLLMSSAEALIYAFGGLLLLLLLVTLLKKQWLAIFALWLMTVLVLGLFFAVGSPWTGWISIMLVAAVNVVCIARFGLLSAVAFQIFFDLSFHNAVTANASSWYFGNTIFTVAILLGLTFYGFYTSLAGQKILETGFLKEVES